MTSAPAAAAAKVARRVIIRAHEYHHDNYQRIVQDWFQLSGYGKEGECYDWTICHHMHLGGVNGGRFHIIIDLEKDCYCAPTRLSDVPLEIYCLRKPTGANSRFEYIDPQKQQGAYLLARELTADIAWGRG